jgi:2-(1,2-epoxy-1,2-dihydrophenyl)acetyl-CoA isomerase
MTDIVLTEWREPGILLITLNRPDVLNAISVKLQRQLGEQLDAAANDPNVRCIVLTGAGDRAFSAGFDIRDFGAMDEDAYALMQLEQEEWIWRLATHPRPIVAAVNGIAHGMGAILATCADLRVGAESATFRVTAAKYGGAGLTWNLPLLIGWSHTFDLLLTARSVNADEGARIGLLNRVVKDHDVLAESLVLAKSIAELPPEGIQGIKRLLRDGVGGRLRSRFDAENTMMRETFRHKPMSDVFQGFLETHSRDKPSP